MVKKEHDEIYWSTNFDDINLSFKTNNLPYNNSSNNVIKQQTIAKSISYYDAIYDNLAENFTHNAPLNNPQINKAYFFLHERTKKLCQGMVSICGVGPRCGSWAIWYWAFLSACGGPKRF